MMPISPRPTNPLAKGNGFTLIELLVVLSIVGLLAAVAMPAIGRKSTSLREPRIRAEVEAILARDALRASETGQTITVDLASITSKQKLSFLAEIGQAPNPIFFADGSSNGGVVMTDGQPLLAIRWLDGEVVRGER